MAERRPAGVHIVRRKNTTTYYFRRRIPLTLQAHYPDSKPRGWITHKLPSAQADAYSEAVRRWAQIDAEFARIKSTGSRLAQQIEPAQAERLAATMVASALGADEEIRRSGALADDGMFERMGENMREVVQSARANLSRGIIDAHLRAVVDDWLAGHGYALDTDSEAFRTVAGAFARRMLQAGKATEQRNEGEDVPTPQAPADTATPATVVGRERLSDLTDYWAKYGDQKREKSIEEGRAAARRFVAVVGDLPLQSIEKSHFFAFRDSRLTKVSGRTVKKDVSLIAAAFNVALADDKFGLKANPADNVRVPMGESKRRGQFTAAQLKLIFECSPYNGEKAGMGEGYGGRLGRHAELVPVGRVVHWRAAERDGAHPA